ncbi:hypothetical protein L596_025110 [Steinernema carpocapsae]|uniref:Secreted protein n=1 Tax=Steinernema carpocapsae TaxID=34508 RepID=A0A4U5M6V0_STECR|nr:hypothetical protein L596_025110 [Steinernema carpocapsae]
MHQHLAAAHLSVQATIARFLALLGIADRFWTPERMGATRVSVYLMFDHRRKRCDCVNFKRGERQSTFVVYVLNLCSLCVQRKGSFSVNSMGTSMTQMMPFVKFWCRLFTIFVV